MPTPRFTIRLSPEDKATFQAAATRAHLDLSAWMRSTLLREAALSEQRAIKTGGARAVTKKED